MLNRPAEWLGKRIIYLAWPCDESLWQENLQGAQQEFLSLLKALNKQRKVILVANQEAKNDFLQKFTQDNLTEILLHTYGDIWLRDTMPIFGKQNNQISCIIPKFNGWGNKYLFKDDKNLAKNIQSHLKTPFVLSHMVFEGGALEFDGEGTMLSTTQCMLNSNRNPGMTKSEIEQEFIRLFNVEKIIWLEEGLLNDHTDGHIDTIARFIAPHTVAIMMANDDEDPNKKIFENIKSILELQINALGKKLTIVELPSPGKIINSDGEIMPASYLNFIFTDDLIIMPIYDSIYDQKALDVLKKATQKKVIGLKAKDILSGGGAFHCISQEYFL